MNTKNILLIGETGSGKSTLANVLSGSNEFKESSQSISTTKNIQTKTFTHNNIDYKIIDTVGLNDTSLSGSEVLERIGKVSSEIKDGLTQILFISNGKFNDNEIKNFELLKEVLFDKNVYKFTTIIRTNFNKFRNEEICKADLEILKQEKPQLGMLINKVNGFIHVNNLPLDLDEEELEVFALKIRKNGKDKILEHLENNCNETYEVDLEKLRLGIAEYKNVADKLENKIKELDQEFEKLKVADKEFKEMKEAEKQELENKLNNILKEIEKTKKEEIENMEKIFCRRQIEMNREIVDLKIENINLRGEVSSMTKSRDQYQRWYRQEKSTNENSWCRII